MISITIICKDNENTIARTIKSCASFDEVVLYDTGSTDRTIEIAKSFPNVSVHHGKLTGFGPTFNKATDSAKNDWILSVDSDEVISDELNAEIQKLTLEKGKVYSFPRHNYYNGKLIKGCGWYPDRLVRIFNRNDTRHTDHLVHPSISQDGLQEVRLTHPLKHLSYVRTSQFISKLQHYTDLYAEDPVRNKPTPFTKVIIRTIYAFIRSYILKGGILDGKEGLVISIYNANSTFYKYLKVWEQYIPKEKRFSLPS